MSYAEVIYETGSHSVVSYDDLDELKAALVDQNNRASSGNPGGPTGHRAERVKRVLLYSNHPGEDNADLAVEVLDDIEAASTQGNTVNIFDVINKLRVAASPLTNEDNAKPHDSVFHAKEDSELDMGFLDSSDDGTVA